MRDLARKLLTLLTPRERLMLYVLFGAAVVAALVDVAGIVSIMPFIGVVANPEIIETNRWLNRAYTTLGFQSTNRFLLFLGIVVLAFLVFNNLFKAFFAWMQLRYMNMREYSISTRLLERYLSQSYIFFLNRNSSEMSRNILSVVGSVTSGILRPCMDIVAKTISCLFILILLIVVEPWLAISTALVLGTFFGMIYWVVRKKLALWGAQSLNANMFRYKLTSEAMGGIKDLLVLGRQHDFLHRYSYYARRNAGIATKNGAVALVPMYAIEILAFGGILGIVLYFIGTKQNIAHVLPFVALYAFAAKRLLPALQGVFASISTIRYNLSCLDVVCDDLMQTTGSASALRLNSDLKTLEFLNSICLKNISFSYPGREERVINALSCEIKANTTVGFVGPTGSGKTTLIDIILGLLVPQVGQLQIDGIPVHKENCTRWQRNIGYVSQHIYLSDDTVARNIAFGIPDEHIELEKVKKAAAIANISRFIEGELPSSYDTLIGERGVRLSGGQRQRIGIARALYHDPDVLILDEATSALDGETESAVMDAIAALSSKKTIIIIAHRLTTLKDCDVIHVLENGRITAQGTYNELIQFSDRFRAMSRIATK